MIHIARNGKQEGPYSLEQVQSLVQAGKLKADDLSWWEGCAGWVPVSQIPGLLAASVSSSAALAQSSPYTAPSAQIVPASYGGVSAETIQVLRETRPWVLFIAILGILWTGLMVFSGLMMLLAGGMAGFSTPSGSSGPAAALPSVVMMGMAAMYLLLGLLYLYPVIKLFKFAGAIGALSRSGSQADLENALRQQKGFWKFLGIMAIVGFISLIGGFILVAITGSALVSSSMKSLPGPASPPTPVTAPAAP